MEAVFLKILNMSITASWIVLAVIVVRLLLKKAPKWIIVLMWGLAGIRLVCPFSLESVFSLIPSAETVPNNILYMDAPTIHSGVAALNSIVNPIISESLAPSVGDSVNPLQVITFVSSMIWIAGITVMLVYTGISYLRIRKKVTEAMPLNENVWVCDHVDTPFILGVIRPRIYLPSAMDGQDMEYVIAHEKAHLKRHDHWWKPLGFLLLAIYWFNPILWIAYLLLCRDIELACDEKVIRNMGTENKKPYSDALINCSVPRRMIAACPLAFGEIGVKARVKSVLNYKKPAFWIIVIAVITCIIVAICFLTDPADPVAWIDAKLAVLIDGEIASHHQSDKSKGNFCCLDWEVIGKETDSNQTTIYMWVLYEEFSNENGLKLEARAHTLTAITVEENDDGCYQLIEYWKPHDGSYYTNSIREKVPIYLWSKAMDPLRYIDEQSAKLENLARRYFSTTAAIRYFNTLQGSDISLLRERYPQYFDLDVSNGLDVYVWQMGENYYSFGLLPHVEPQRDKFSTELLSLQETDAKEMRQILSTYDIDENDISIIPWYNPISSYLGDYGIIYEGESIEEKQEYYRGLFRDMLFGEPSVAPSYFDPIYDSLIFDVDGDGKDEHCILGYGITSGLFTFTFSASEVGAKQPKYSNVFCTKWYDLSFVSCDDGIVRVQGIDLKEIPHLFDISIIDGNVHLTEDGRDIDGQTSWFSIDELTSLFTTEPQSEQ